MARLKRCRWWKNQTVTEKFPRVKDRGQIEVFTSRTAPEPRGLCPESQTFRGANVILPTAATGESCLLYAVLAIPAEVTETLGLFVHSLSVLVHAACWYFLVRDYLLRHVG